MDRYNITAGHNRRTTATIPAAGTIVNDQPARKFSRRRRLLVEAEETATDPP
jgi:hypothetical protein